MGAAARCVRHKVSTAQARLHPYLPTSETNRAAWVNGAPTIFREARGDGAPLRYIDLLQQANLVIVAKHVHAQVRSPGEVADGQGCAHGHNLGSPPMGESSGGSALDPPTAGREKLDINRPQGWPEKTRSRHL